MQRQLNPFDSETFDSTIVVSLSVYDSWRVVNENIHFNRLVPEQKMSSRGNANYDRWHLTTTAKRRKGKSKSFCLTRIAKWQFGQQ